MKEIKRLSELDESRVLETIKIFWEAFGHYFPEKYRVKFEHLLLVSMDCSRVYVYLEQDKVIGFIGLETHGRRTFEFSVQDCIHQFGKLRGRFVCQKLNSIFSKPKIIGDSDLSIDFLAATELSRGKGVGTKLLEFAFSLPGFEEYYIEVVSKNTEAKRLYVKMGFVEHKKKFMAYTKDGYLIQMKKKP